MFDEYMYMYCTVDGNGVLRSTVHTHTQSEGEILAPSYSVLHGTTVLEYKLYTRRASGAALQ